MSSLPAFFSPLKDAMALSLFPERVRTAVSMRSCRNSPASSPSLPSSQEEPGVEDAGGLAGWPWWLEGQELVDPADVGPSPTSDVCIC